MAFLKATKSWIKQLDPEGDWNRLKNVTDHEDFRLLYLVQRKKSNLWWQTSFKKTACKLEDVLLSKDDISRLDLRESDPYTVVDKVSRNGKADVGGGADIASANLMASASESHEWQVKLKKRSIPVHQLYSLENHGCTVLLTLRGDNEAASGQRNIKMDHDVIKQVKQSKNDLYVITEAIETMEEIWCEEAIKAEGQFSLGAIIVPRLNLKVGMQGNTSSRKGITIPKAATVAFRVYQLLPEETFQSKIETIRVPGESQSKGLQLEIKEECAKLFLSPANACGKFLTGFVAIMRESDLLQKLEFQLEQTLESKGQLTLKADKPELRGLVDNLQHPNGTIYTYLVNPVLYFLQALDELTELQLLLLAESVEKKIVFNQFALVGNILDSDFSEKEVDFTVDAQLVSPFTEEDLNLTTAMIEPTGVTVKKVGPGLVGTGDRDAYLALCPLYVALCVLAVLQRKA